MLGPGGGRMGQRGSLFFPFLFETLNENSHNNKKGRVGRRKKHREGVDTAPRAKGHRKPICRQRRKPTARSVHHGGIPRAWGQAKGGRWAVGSGERKPLVLGGRAGTCLDPSKPMGKM